MANKLKGLAGAMSGNQFAAAVRESAQQIWLAGVGALSTAREQRNKMFEALVREGKAIQAVTKNGANTTLREAAAKAAGTRDMLEQVLENSFTRSLKRFGVPTRKDIRNLSTRVVALNALVDKVTAEVSRKSAARRGKRKSG
jgi:poly(hydroxyalkanoate) granule-associated protein